MGSVNGRGVAISTQAVPIPSTSWQRSAMRPWFLCKIDEMIPDISWTVDDGIRRVAAAPNLQRGRLSSFYRTSVGRRRAQTTDKKFECKLSKQIYETN
jgi:hypothetical protein